MAQIVAVGIFVLMFALIIMDKIPKHIITLCCAGATILVVFGLLMRSPEAIWETLNLRSIGTVQFWYEAGEAADSTSGINWATIFFIFPLTLSRTQS